jgi:argininosuccinate synthase
MSLQARIEAGAAELRPPRSVLLAYSGGLDSTLCIELLRRVYRIRDLRLVLFDVGQGEAEVDKAMRYAAQLDAPRPEVIDLRAQFYDHWLVRAVHANARRRGYPMAAPIAKQLMARELGALALRLGVEAVAEGSSGRGNDQFRMTTPLRTLSDELRVVAPIRDLDLTRDEEEQLCAAWNVPVDTSLPRGGDDVTLWCRSIASGAVTLEDPLPSSWKWWRDPTQAGPRPEPITVTLGFEAGVPVSLAGDRMRFVDIVARLNELAGSRGVGCIDIIEDGILGLKSRELYEAPGATVILTAHQDLEHLCLTADELQFKASVEARWIELVYGAALFHPLVSALDAFIAATQPVVTGSVSLRIGGGGLQVVARSSPYSLYQQGLRDISVRAFDQRRLEGAVFAHGLPYTALRRRSP